MESSENISGEIQGLSFEEALRELEMTVLKLEAGDLTLQESLQLFERGQALAVICNTQLETAVLKVEQLTSEGEIIEVPITSG